MNIRRGRRPKPLTSSKHRVTPLGTALRAWREYWRLSQTELAIQAGLGVAQDGRAHISSIELGKIQQPEDETLEKIAPVLGITVKDLRSGSMPPTGQTQDDLETVRTSVDRLQLSPRRGFGFRAPVLSESHAADRADQLKEILTEIAEITRRIEEIKRVVEELLRSEERVR